MNKCVCDMCRQNPTNHKFKVKRLLSVVRSEMHVMRWVRIDICDSCFNKLLRIKDGGDTDADT